MFFLKNLKKNKGFTLIEFLISFVILGLIVSILFVYISTSRIETKDTAISLNIAQIESIAEMIYLNSGSYDSLCLDSASLSSERGLNIIQEDIIKNGGEVACFAEGDNYCISAKLNNGEFFYIKNNIKARIGESSCINSTTGGREEDNIVVDGGDNDLVPITDASCYSEENLILQIDARYHALALKSDGTVYAWGRNWHGQLGDGTTSSSTVPIQVLGLNGEGYLSNIESVVAGENHSLGLDSSGTIWSWGFNSHGQLGDGTLIRKLTPIRVLGVGGTNYLTNIKSISAGNSHSLALREDGILYTWGSNSNGQLGDGGTADKSTPIQVLNNVLSVEGGSVHTVALKEDGTVWTWGNNQFGQLGNNSWDNSYEPVQVVGTSGVGYIEDIISISSGLHTLALKSDGTVYAWGYNSHGQLGDNTAENRNVPVQVKGVGGSGYLTDIVSISSRSTHSLALKSDGTVYSWGNNQYGQLGDNTQIQKYTPIQVKDITGESYLTEIEGIGTGIASSFAFNNKGEVFSWGYNGEGIIGDNSGSDSLIPVRIWNLGAGSITKIKAGAYHSLAVNGDGSLFSWGYNSSGQIGDNTSVEKFRATKVKDETGNSFLTDIIDSAGGGYHSLAITQNGGVYSWGNNNAGQLGNNSTTNSLLPIKVLGVGGSGYLSNIIKIAGGNFHSVASNSSGQVFTWGNNMYGQLGNNSTTTSLTPIQVSITNVIEIASGDFHTLALKSDGTVWGWGKNSNGQLGDNTTTDRLTPVQVKGVGGSGNLTDIIKISAGNWFSLALNESGEVYSWGYNNYGQLGNNNSTDSLTPIQVLGLNGEGYLNDIIDVSSGASHSLALKSDGTVYAWGRNNYGQLGDRSVTTRRVPVNVKDIDGESNLSNIISINASRDNHSLALKEDGVVYAWGANNYGQLGNNTILNSALPARMCDLSIIEDVEEPEPVLGCMDDTALNYNPLADTGDGSCQYACSPFTEVSGGDAYGHSLGLKSDGTVWAWGDNRFGQLGDGTIMSKLTPIQVKGVGGSGYLTDIIAISAGGGYSLALGVDGTVWAWGRNDLYKLGDGTTTNRLTPIQVKGVGGSGYLTDIIAISAGERHSLALKEDGTIWAWGDNLNGWLGDGTTIQRTTPVQVLKGESEEEGEYLTGIISISAGQDHSLVLKEDGTIFAWGGNTRRQLGDGTTTNRLTPIQVKGVGGLGYLTDITDISGGFRYSLALKSDGTVYGWGYNIYGQLGDGTTIDKSTPVQVKGVNGNGYLVDVMSISTKMYHSLALKEDGTVFAWGNNNVGQLGDNSITQRITPVQVKGIGGIGYLTNITEISSGNNYSLALRSDGLVYTWGGNSYGQLGDGTTNNSNVPVKVIDCMPEFGASIIQTSASNRGFHSLALKSDGTVWSWGRNSIGQLGDGTQLNRLIPFQVKHPNGEGYLTNITEVSAGEYHSLGLAVGGTVYSWGWNYYGQLGNNATTSTLLPVQVKGVGGAGFLENVKKISAGARHNLVLKEDGTVFGWGRNSYSQLGDGSVRDRISPIQVRGAFGSGYLTNIIDVSSGGIHSLALKSDGTVWAWGNNDLGQLGNNSTTTAIFPIQVKGVDGTGYLTDIIGISAGYIHSLALKSDGTVYAWGRNFNGQLGNNTTLDSLTPIKVLGVAGIDFLEEIKEVKAGENFSLALNKDGAVFSWGYNNLGQLGDQTIVSTTTPVKVKGFNGIDYLTNVRSISAGGSHNLALKFDGTLWSWGNNLNGQLGDNTVTNRTTPVLVLWDVVPNNDPSQEPEPDPDPEPVLGCMDDTALNYNYLADTDDGSCDYHPNPFIKISAGSGHSLGLLQDGTVWSWGNNSVGELGDGTTYDKTIPVQVKGPGGVGYLTDVEAIYAGYNYSLALKSDGTVYAWGYNYFGQLGDNTTINKNTPVQVTGLTDIKFISGGYWHSFAVENDGTLWAWGYNASGQLGDQTVIDKTTPVQVKGVGGVGNLTNITSVSGGWLHSIAVKEDGTVYTWGWNSSGQLGDQTVIDKTTPVQVKGVGGVGNLTNITSVSAGGLNSFALKNENGTTTVYSWGDNSYGDLGDNTIARRTTPVQVKGVGGVGYLTDVIAISTKNSNTIALKSDGTVWAWGYNIYGQLGDGTTYNRTTPVQVKGVGGVGYLTNIKDISAGSYYNLALKKNGTVWAWGSNNYGQLGDNTIANKSTPVKVIDPEVPLVLGGFSWARSIGGVGWDTASSIIRDNNNLYIVGTFSGTVDFDPGVGVYNLVSQGSTDTFILKLNSSGNFVWVKQIKGFNSVQSFQIVFDSNNNMYISGYFLETADFDPGVGVYNFTSIQQSIDGFILKLDSNGNFVWAKQIGGANTDIVFSIDIDSNDNVYATGYFGGIVNFNRGGVEYMLTSKGSADIFILKLDSNGNFVWAKSIEGAGIDAGYSVVTSGNDLYISGYFRGTADFDPGVGTYNLNSNGNTDAFILKLDSNGNFVWAKQIGGTNNDAISSIAIANDNNLYITGYFADTVDFNPGIETYYLNSKGSYDAFILKLDSSGNFVWAKSVGGSGDDFGQSIVLDNSSNVYITGSFTGTVDFDPGTGIYSLISKGERDIFILKLDSNGNFVWAKSMGGTERDTGLSIIIDNENLYVTGYFSRTVDFNTGIGVYNLTSNGNYDAFILKLFQ